MAWAISTEHNNGKQYEVDTSMSRPYQPQGRSPPPLQHPVPTHARYQIPEPPDTPTTAAEPTGYLRFISPPQHQQTQQRVNIHQPAAQPPYAQQTQFGAYGAQQYQSFAGGPGPQQPPPPPMQGMNLGGAWGVNDVTAQMGMQLGRSAVQAGHDYVEKNLGIRLLPVSVLKQRFNVSNAYVLHKLQIIIFPWRHRPWSRKVRRSETNGQSEGWQPPREDINSPDLYIPTMALVTYILLTAFAAGLEKNFRPDLLGITASTALAVLVLEFALIKLGCYFLNIQGQSQVIDFVAYGGYKFVGTIVTVIAKLMLGGRASWAYWAIFLYTFGANAFFLLRSLKYIVFPDSSAAPASDSVGNAHTVNQAQRGWRIRFLFAVAVSQILFMGILALS